MSLSGSSNVFRNHAHMSMTTHEGLLDYSDVPLDRVTPDQKALTHSLPMVTDPHGRKYQDCR